MDIWVVVVVLYTILSKVLLPLVLWRYPKLRRFIPPVIQRLAIKMKVFMTDVWDAIHDLFVIPIRLYRVCSQATLTPLWRNDRN